MHNSAISSTKPFMKLEWGSKASASNKCIVYVHFHGSVFCFLLLNDMYRLQAPSHLGSYYAIMLELSCRCKTYVLVGSFSFVIMLCSSIHFSPTKGDEWRQHRGSESPLVVNICLVCPGLDRAALDSSVMFSHARQVVLRKQWQDHPRYAADDFIPRAEDVLSVHIL